MRRLLLLMLTICCILLSISACSNDSTCDIDLDSLESRIAELEAENEKLKKENLILNEENTSLNEKLNAQKQEVTVQDEDISVKLTGKSSATDRWDQPYVDFVFSVTNNTDKTIKGIQGSATFKDIFDIDIISMNCDFTGNSIDSGASITVDDLSFDCNQFMDDHMKLYTTAFDDLHFEYKVTAIVFTDGTTKTLS